MSRGEDVVVFTNPVLRPDYVRSFVMAYLHGWGLRSVLLFPRSASALRVAESNALIGTQGIAATFMVDLDDLSSVAAMIAARYRVRAVVPQAEMQVVPAARLAELLGIDWMSADTMALFRDKYRLKDLLRGSATDLRINRSAIVHSAQEAQRLAEHEDLARFVLKPNDGAGNSHIGFFDQESTPQALRRYFEDGGERPVLLEEYLPGPEYCVNGQVDDAGVVRVYSVQRTVHVAANGRTNLAGAFRMMRTSTVQFQQATRYADHVLRTIGLCRSPFHMEVKIGPDGPRLIEVAARLGGAGIPLDTAFAHGGQVDLFTEAAAFYANLTTRPAEPDWSTYDSHAIGTVLGVSERHGMITGLQGSQMLERCPEFAYWVIPPQLGQRVTPTVDLASSPWQVTLCADDDDALLAAEARARRLVERNHLVSTQGISVERAMAVAAWSRRHRPAVSALVTSRPRRLGNGDVRPPTPAGSRTSA